MIDEIQVSNVALIREASFAPSAGFTVLTGETGAGKTALLSALRLLMGGRAHSDTVRDGEDALRVSGRFYLKNAEPDEDAAPTGQPDLFQGAGEEYVITRQVTADGRSRGAINGQMASMGELAELLGPSIDLCGQFEHQQLMRTANHVKLLDAWAGEEVASAKQVYDQALSAAKTAQAELQRVEEAGALSQAKLDDARFICKRIGEVNPEADEYDSLRAKLKLAENAEALALAANTAREALAGEEGALDAIGTAMQALDRGGMHDPALAELATQLREADYVLEDLAAAVRDYAERIDFDPETLVAQQERFAALQGLLRAYGPRMEDVFERWEAAAETVSLVDDADRRLELARKAADEAERALSEAADALDAARAAAAPRFEATVAATMQHLEMGSAWLTVLQERQERRAWTAAGPSTVEFLYQPASDMQPRPLTRIASGGEVSRVLLAIKVALGATDQVDTLVFDEVDAGVGGSVAVALADVVAQLAETHQVIAVTHLAQLAVRADAHYVVERGAADETRIFPVTGEDRVREVARMLSGTATDVSLAHARELLGQNA